MRVALSRWFARLVDKLIIGGVFLLAGTWLGSGFSPTPSWLGAWWWFVLFVVAFPFVEALALSWFQRTPGKLLLGIGFRMQSPFDYRLALQRSWRVWFWGEAFLTPVGIVTNYLAFLKVVATGRTTWDRELNIDVVILNPASRRDVVAEGLIIVALFAILVFL